MQLPPRTAQRGALLARSGFCCLRNEGFFVRYQLVKGAAYSITDLLTTLNQRTNRPPTSSLICRKLDALPRDTFDSLGLIIAAKTGVEDGVRLSSDQIGGIERAVSCKFQADTASEIAHVHACGGVTSAAAVKAAYYEQSHVLRIGL